MRVIRRIVLIVLILALIVAAAGLGGIFYLTRRPFPQINGTLRADGLTTPVTVIRDTMGVPHVYADNLHDLFFAQGYVHAQDRLWQMDSYRRTGAGRLSELSPSQIGTDKFLRALGWRRAAQADLEVVSEQGRDILDAYAEGVNAFLGAHQGALPMEYVVLGLFAGLGPPEDWGPVDSLQMAKVLGWDLSGNWDTELLRAALIDQFGPDDGPDVVASLFPTYNAERPVIIRQDELAWDTLSRSLLAQNRNLQDLLGVRTPETGSNNWVISGARTTTGKPLLANDPHLGIGMPSIWYFNALHCQPVSAECPFDVMGSSLAGVPGIVIGHNARIAWGATNVGPDVQDLFIERIDGDRYEYRGEMLPLETTTEVITVNGTLPEDYESSPNETVEYDAATDTTTVTLTVRFTQHGPLISDVSSTTADLISAGEAVAFSWTAINAPERTLDAFLGLNQAQNWDDFRNALSIYGTPSQNFVYADVDGNIGYQMPGRIPIRAQGNGELPAPGWTGEYEWIDYIPFDELPSTFNPEKGYIATANNAVVDESYAYFISSEWASYRAQRLHDLFENQQIFSPEDVMQMQGDNYNVSASEIAPALNDLSVEGDAQKVLDAIRAWDLVNQRDKAGAGAYETFWLFLLRNTFDDELGDLAAEYVSGGDFNREVVRRMVDQPDARWWDNVNTTDVTETRDDIFKQSLADAAAALTAEFGADPSGWTWGKLHTATFRHAVMGGQPVAFMFNRGPVAVDGGAGILNNTGGNFRAAYTGPGEPPAKLVNIFAERTAPSLRIIDDLSDWNASLYIHTTGQSGLPYHPHYEDMIDLWRNIQYAPMWWERNSVEADAEGTLTLSP
jgi:penicillin amidase